MKSLCSASQPGVFAVMALLATSYVRADVTGAILGTVTDPTGAVIVAAHVALRNQNTGLNRSAATDQNGNYQFLQVPVGQDYVVEVEAAGFQKGVQNGIVLQVNQSFRADFQLQVGTAAQSVEVSAAIMQVETNSTQLGDVIDDHKMTTLPLNGRSYLDLLGLQAGVVPTASSAANNDRKVSGNLDAGQVSVNGQRESANSFLVNGGDVEESVDNGASIVPTLDSIAEFRLLTNSFNAEYGRFSGGIVNVVTKSGTNEIHGSVYEFLRNEKLDARSYFDPERGDFKRNQFGGTIGAPVVRNKLFFFGDYQGTREIRGVSSNLVNVPSVLERTGDFSELPDDFTGSVAGSDDPALGNFPSVLTQRLGYTVKSGEAYWFLGCNINDPTTC